MKLPAFLNGVPRRDLKAFSVVDVTVILCVTSLLAMAAAPTVWKVRKSTHNAVDLNNVRQIMLATQMYATDNRDYMPHPTWGGELSGPDGWCYATRNRGRIPGGPEFPGSAAGFDLNSTAFSNQLKFFKISQLAPWIEDQTSLWCPSDRASWRRGPAQSRWLGRPVKLTSYSMNATTAGYVGIRGPLPLVDGKTFKISEFLPNDIILNEPNGQDPFNFNDAGFNPENPSEAVSFRHTSDPEASLPSQNRNDLPWLGGALVGRIGGNAEMIEINHLMDLVNRKIPPPNDLLNLRYR